MSDTKRLATYWGTRYATEVSLNAHAVPPLLVFVGGTADAIVAAEDTSHGDIPKMAETVAVFTYPTDAVHVVACFQVIAFEMTRPNDLPEDPLYDPRSRAGVCVWSHTIPTGESDVAVLVRTSLTEDDQDWVGFSDTVPPPEMFDPLRGAAHEFDRAPLDDNEGALRHRAIHEILDNNGVVYTASFYEPGAVLGMVRADGAESN